VEGEHVKYAAHCGAGSGGRAVAEHGSMELVVSGNRFYVGLAGDLRIPIHPHEREADRSVLVVVGDDYFDGIGASDEQGIDDDMHFVDGATVLAGDGTSSTGKVAEPVQPASGSLVEEHDMHRAVDDSALTTFERDLQGPPPGLAPWRLGPAARNLAAIPTVLRRLCPHNDASPKLAPSPCASAQADGHR
jgi:hypothetical protein